MILVYVFAGPRHSTTNCDMCNCHIEDQKPRFKCMGCADTDFCIKCAKLANNGTVTRGQHKPWHVLCKFIFTKGWGCTEYSKDLGAYTSESFYYTQGYQIAVLWEFVSACRILLNASVGSPEVFLNKFIVLHILSYVLEEHIALGLLSNSAIIQVIEIAGQRPVTATNILTARLLSSIIDCVSEQVFLHIRYCEEQHFSQPTSNALPSTVEQSNLKTVSFFLYKNSGNSNVKHKHGTKQIRSPKVPTVSQNSQPASVTNANNFSVPSFDGTIVLQAEEIEIAGTITAGNISIFASSQATISKTAKVNASNKQQQQQ